MSEREKTDSRIIGSSDKFLATALQRNAQLTINKGERWHKDVNWTCLRKEKSLEYWYPHDHKPKCLEFRMWTSL
ncbi:hypothetical protein TNCV_4729241 [Trichonephila clavipes]|nr:hypothetical protein TNCV_4729241 [Trichonephila clavipes]